tara:strand:+ start:13893 stop:14060 length:168 start_codon:yes stop_codon:yes gene_type:complete
MMKTGDCRFIGSVISLKGGASARVIKVRKDKISIVDLDGSLKECYYNDINYVWTP